MFESCRAHRSLPRLGRRFELADHPAVLVVRADEGDLAALWEGDPDLADVGWTSSSTGRPSMVKVCAAALSFFRSMSVLAGRALEDRRLEEDWAPRRSCPSHPCARPGSLGSSLPLPRPRRHRIQRPRPPARPRPGRSRSASYRDPTPAVRPDAGREGFAQPFFELGFRRRRSRSAFRESTAAHALRTSTAAAAATPLALWVKVTASSGGHQDGGRQQRASPGRVVPATLLP